MFWPFHLDEPIWSSFDFRTLNFQRQRRRAAYEVVGGFEMAGAPPIPNTHSQVHRSAGYGDANKNLVEFPIGGEVAKNDGVDKANSEEEIYTDDDCELEFGNDDNSCNGKPMVGVDETNDDSISKEEIPFIGKVFATSEDACKFYNQYALTKGFRMRLHLVSKSSCGTRIYWVNQYGEGQNLQGWRQCAINKGEYH